MTDTRVLWASDYVLLPSAYGTQTKVALNWLNGDDRDLTVDHQPLAANQKVMFEPGTPFPYRIWPGEGPAHQQQFRGNLLREHFYRGDYDLGVALKDCLAWLPKMHQSPIPKVLYTPIPSDPAPPALFDSAEKWTAVWCPSKNGVDQFDDNGVVAEYMPHFVDSHAFRPIREDDPIDRADVREEAGFEPDDYIVGFVGLNRGERKDIGRIIEAFDIWRNQFDHPEARLYLHTEMEGSGQWGGINVRHLMAKLQMSEDVVGLTDPWKREVGYSSTGMAKFYNVLDCYLGTERGAGFAVPLLEAAACGTPVVATAHAAMRERVDEGENGFLVDPTITETNHMIGTSAIPDVDDIAIALEQIYERDWDRDAVRETVIPEFDVEPIIEERMIPALNRVYNEVYPEFEVAP